MRSSKRRSSSTTSSAARVVQRSLAALQRGARRKRDQRRLESLLIMRGGRRQALAGRATGNVKLTVQEAQEAGRLVIGAKAITKSYGDLTPVHDFSMKIARGMVSASSAKPAPARTLINLLTSALPPMPGACASAPLWRSPP